MAKKKNYSIEIPKQEIESLARCLLPEIHRYSIVKMASGSSKNGKQDRRKIERRLNSQIGRVASIIVDTARPFFVDTYSCIVF